MKIRIKSILLKSIFPGIFSMNRNIYLSLIIILLFSGCFGFFKKNVSQNPGMPEKLSEAQEPKAAGQTVEEPQLLNIPEVPSFQDGDVYFQAISSGDIETCRKIINAQLKARCITEVRKIKK